MSDKDGKILQFKRREPITNFFDEADESLSWERLFFLAMHESYSVQIECLRLDGDGVYSFVPYAFVEKIDARLAIYAFDRDTQLFHVEWLIEFVDFEDGGADLAAIESARLEIATSYENFGKPVWVQVMESGC